MSQFINDRETIVTEAIDGLLQTSGCGLSRLDGYPHIKVVIRRDWQPATKNGATQVALISGGGSGHEPAHAGFVGQGMLTAAVCGDVFASPSVDAVLAAIMAVTGGAGCLLIVKNYTGDRLNFGLAAARARAAGRNVAMVVVDDDVALPDLPQPRGVAGTLLVHKIAGALAENGADLETVAAAARNVISKVASIGMSLDTCTVPGAPKEQRLPAGMAELGLGIHGEPGAEQVIYTNAADAMAKVAARLQPHLTGGRHVALLNNLGGTTPLEMSVLASELLRSEIGPGIDAIIGPAALMTSLDMRGFSVSILPVTEQDVAALQQPVAPPAWPGLATIDQPNIQSMPANMTPVKPAPSTHPARQALLVKACNIFIAAEQDLNALDAKSGDGDTGTTLATAARAILRAVKELPLADIRALYSAIGQELSQSMGGSSGVLLAIFFSAAAEHDADGDNDVQTALSAGLTRISEVGGAKTGDRTLIDALAPALAALPHSLTAAAKAARDGADATAAITTAKAGRAAYVPAAMLQGNNDPGAEAVARLFEGLAVD